MQHYRRESNVDRGKLVFLFINCRVFWNFKVDVSTSKVQFWYYLRIHLGLRRRTTWILEKIFKWFYGNENVAIVLRLLHNPLTSIIQCLFAWANHGWRWSWFGKTFEIKANILIRALSRTQPFIIWWRSPQTK